MNKKRKLEENPMEALKDLKEYNIYSEGNKIYFYSIIDTYSIFLLNKEIDEVVNDIKSNNVYDSYPHIKLFVHTNGGNLYAGLSGMEHIRTCEFDIHAYVDGFVASAGTLLILGAKKRIMYKYSDVLIHQLSTGFWGKYEEMVEEAKNCKKLMKMMKDIYKTYTVIPDEILDTLMTKEINLNSKKCLKYKIVDIVV